LCAHPIATAVPADIKEYVKEALTEHDASKREKTLVCSKANRSEVAKMLSDYNVKVIMGDPPLEPELKFLPFDWSDRNEDDPGAMCELLLHLNTELGKAGAPFGSGCFHIVDVHSNNTLLSLDDEKFKKICGGTDFLILPQKVAKISYAAEICVVFEVKTTKRMGDGGIEKNTPQLILELFAARYHSDQPNILAVLSDIHSSTCVMELQCDEMGEVSIIQYDNISLSQMGAIVASHLRSPIKAIPRPNYTPKPDEPAAKGVIGFKRKFKTNLTSTVAWEQYTDMVEDTLPFSAERRFLTNQLFRQWGVEMEPSHEHSTSMYV
jgi:hypothetical protein